MTCLVKYQDRLERIRRWRNDKESRVNTVRILVAIVAAAMAPLAFATPIEADTHYDINNHPDGNARPPLYGLRLDGLTSGNSSDIFTFDFDTNGASMSMFWDSATDSLTISGFAFGGLNDGNAYADGSDVMWSIMFTYAGIYECGDGLCANTGNGVIMSEEFGGFDLVAESGNHSYAFQLGLDHRGVAGVSGWGWMNHCPSSSYTSASVDQPRSGGSCDTHLYSSDWLFTVASVPEPAPLALLSSALLAMGVMRRKKLKAA